MNIKKISREGKEQIYITKMLELQTRWGNPIDSNWDFIKDWSDDVLDKNIHDTIGQLRFEKAVTVIKFIAFIIIISISIIIIRYVF